MLRQIYLGVGSNINRKRNIENSIRALRRHFTKLSLSPVYETAAVGFDGGDFYNLVVGFESKVELEVLAQILKTIEDDNGRVRGNKKFSDRSLDIDILLYGEDILYNKKLDIPRKEIEIYPFVLKPLADLAPELTHPLLGKTMTQLWADFDKTEIVLKPIGKALEI